MRRIVITGGPGAGKTAVLELVRQSFCHHVAVLPEAASILFRGGFPRRAGGPPERAAQRAIFHVQRELEASEEDRDAAIVLCDRGTLDGLAYWPGLEAELLAAMRTTREEELRRYHAIIHLRTPGARNGYNHQNQLRIESAQEAARIDARIVEAWRDHPRRHFVESTHDFLSKSKRTLELIAAEVPSCCRLSEARSTQ
jgi:predicted ATPase